MAEYIEREAVLERVKCCLITSENPIPEEVVDMWCEGVFDAVEQIAESVRDIPAADVVEVVRCKDCEYYEDEECVCPYIFMSDAAHLYPSEDDFCNYGKRKE